MAVGLHAEDSTVHEEGEQMDDEDQWRADKIEALEVVEKPEPVGRDGDEGPKQPVRDHLHASKHHGSEAANQPNGARLSRGCTGAGA